MELWVVRAKLYSVRFYEDAKCCLLLQVILDLLISKPEQEQKLLSGLVNKLGDPERKVAANVAHLLTLLGKLYQRVIRTSMSDL